MIVALGAYVLRSLTAVAEVITIFGGSLTGLLRQITHFKFRYRQTVHQMYAIGVQSLPVMVFSLTFVSLMLVLEFSFHMKMVLRQDSLVPAFSTLLLLRELGPVVTCLLLTSRVGAGIAAELGSMKVTEQIDALRMLGLDPVEFLTLPRWIACVFAAASLTLISLGVAIVGGAVIAATSLGYPLHQYFNLMFVFTHFGDLRGCLVKTVTFGTIIPIVASHYGFQCRQGSEGVGNAATAAVVQGSILIIIADFVLTYLLYAL